MALNWTMLAPDRSPVPLPNEMTITTVDSGADLSLTIPDTPPAGSSPAGGSGGARKLKAVGKILLTDQRLLFTSSSPSSVLSPNSDNLDTLSVPLHSILSTRFEQPTFGANYLYFEIKPSPSGGLAEGTSAMLKFKDRPMFEFIGLLQKTRERSIYMKRQQTMEDEEGPPSYSAPPESSVRVMGSASVPVENPPGYND